MSDLPWVRQQTSEALPLPSSQSNSNSSQSESAQSNGPKAQAESSHTLFQGSFHFCTVKMIGDLAGPASVYVEIVVDRDSGTLFAKVYGTRDPLNAVDILQSRVLPFFAGGHPRIKEIHTHKSIQYCGLPTVHSFESFLARKHIPHEILRPSEHLYYHYCEQYYWYLLHKFFQPSLRKYVSLRLQELQLDLDEFLRHYNADKATSVSAPTGSPAPARKFPVDL